MSIMENNSENYTPAENQTAAIKVRVPKRVLHFSDGIVEEFSEDETDNNTPRAEAQTSLVDPKTLTWGPWMLYLAWTAGSSTLAACDYVGESLASFFNITGPKYYFEIEEFKKREEEKKKVVEDRQGWVDDGNIELCTKEPTTGPTHV